jgi:hypothetical protein
MEEGQVNRRRLTLVTGFAKALSKVETVLRQYSVMCPYTYIYTHIQCYYLQENSYPADHYIIELFPHWQNFVSINYINRSQWPLYLRTRPLACWDCGFEQHRGMDVCPFWVLCCSTCVGEGPVTCSKKILSKCGWLTYFILMFACSTCSSGLSCQNYISHRVSLSITCY